VNSKDGAEPSTVTQIHLGEGNNVNQQIYNEIRSLAPDDFREPFEQVFESLRNNDREKALTQIGILKPLVKLDARTSALMEVLLICSGLIEENDKPPSRAKVIKLFRASNEASVKDLCLAALLQLSRGSDSEEQAKQLYLSEAMTHQYANEVFFKIYADKECIKESLGNILLTEGEISGIVQGALRLGMDELAVSTAERLNKEHYNYNSKYLFLFAKAVSFNSVLSVKHYWLYSKEEKERLDLMLKELVELISSSKLADDRLYYIACPFYVTTLGDVPEIVYDYLKQNYKLCEKVSPEHADLFKPGELISQPAFGDFCAAQNDNSLANNWCDNFLKSESHKSIEVIRFFKIASSDKIREWMSKSIPIVDTTSCQSEFLLLLGNAFDAVLNPDNKSQGLSLEKSVGDFLEKNKDFKDQTPLDLIYMLAVKLMNASLSATVFKLISPLIPKYELWLSPVITLYIKCLYDVGHYASLQLLIDRVHLDKPSFDVSIHKIVMEERLGNIDFAFDLADTFIDNFPDNPTSWKIGCYLRDKYKSEEDQIDFHKLVPIELFCEFSSEALKLAKYISKYEAFTRIELSLLQGFLKAPIANAHDFVNLYFNSFLLEANDISKGYEFGFHPSIEAFVLEYAGDTIIRIFVDDHLDNCQYTLKSSSDLGKKIKESPIGSYVSSGIRKYKVVERLPPYVACIRIATSIRDVNNDGTDGFAVLKLPEKTEDIIPFLSGFVGERPISDNDLKTKLPFYFYMQQAQGHDFEKAIQCWTDKNLPCPKLIGVGVSQPDSIVLDIYGIGYLSVTNLVESLIKSGTKICLPQETFRALELIFNSFSSPYYSRKAFNIDMKLVTFSAEDMERYNGHILRSFKLILDNSTVVYPTLHNSNEDFHFLKRFTHASVYDAIEISASNDIPWLSMDPFIGNFHNTSGYLVVDSSNFIKELILKTPFNLDQNRHGLSHYAVGSLSRPLLLGELSSLSSSTNPLAGYIIYNIFINHGAAIFTGTLSPIAILEIIVMHLECYLIDISSVDLASPSYTPGFRYYSHVFNFGLRLFVDTNDGETFEESAATALFLMIKNVPMSEQLITLILHLFEGFIRGHFLDLNHVAESFHRLIEPEVR
tara:strand:+ start:838 stop:4167 length:3330 start_codon:yes stop_codon:yes gene_type:complete